MNVSLGWLGAMLGQELDAADVARRLAMLGAPVEGIEELHRDLDDLVIGLVERVEPHPNADRLSRCWVNDGTDVREVVCGAPNVRAGAKYPYAPVGATLPGGIKLSARKIRGVVSHGMLCSPRELGLGADHEGILELVIDAPPGTRFVDAVPLGDTRLELEITANRPDLLGHRGVARELGAALGQPVKLPAIPGAPTDGPASRRVDTRGSVGGIEVSIEDREGCPRYMAAVVRGITVGPSPAWLEARLLGIGARPINNVVDATNYILFELNQPLHAFDLARIRGGKIIVRRAEAGEVLETLDGEARRLSPIMTMICDAQGATAVGGVMGGAISEVSDATTDVLLECAYFDPKRIRATRQALRMSTDASYRFERGTDPDAMPEVLRRAVALIRAVAGGTEPEGAIDVYPSPARPRSIFLRPSRVGHVLGVDLSSDEIQRLLVSLGFAVAPKDDRLHVQIPSWRPDVTREVDLIEEIARLRGYDSFPLELRPFRSSSVPDDPGEVRKRRIRELLTGAGLHEARLSPLTRVDHEAAASLANPLSADEGQLRMSLLPGLVAAVERNWSARVRDVRLFEIGTVFHRERRDALPTERQRVAGVVTGARTPAHWSAAGKTDDFDRWDLRALFGAVAEFARVDGSLRATQRGWEWLASHGDVCGEARVMDADRPAWAADVLGFEIDLDIAERPYVQSVALPTTPAIERDLALVLPGALSAERVEETIRESAGALLERCYIFDEYRGKELGGRSVAWRLVFRSPGRTLREEDADAVVDRVVVELKERFDVVRR
ncbi:MAG TPA: phenylalanine--tRNA ligase subunit beta [Gemmatimonadales bacterium]|jgi:phenylalanyl-tRNA synthetase beta chain